MDASVVAVVVSILTAGFAFIELRRKASSEYVGQLEREVKTLREEIQLLRAKEAVMVTQYNALMMRFVDLLDKKENKAQ